MVDVTLFMDAEEIKGVESGVETSIYSLWETI